MQLVYVAELKLFIPVPPETCLSSLFFLCHPNKKENILGWMFSVVKNYLATCENILSKWRAISEFRFFKQ